MSEMTVHNRGRRQFLAQTTIGLGGSALFAALPLAPVKVAAAVGNPYMLNRKTVTVYMGYPEIDFSGLAEPYRPPSRSKKQTEAIEFLW